MPCLEEDTARACQIGVGWRRSPRAGHGGLPLVHGDGRGADDASDEPVHTGHKKNMLGPTPAWIAKREDGKFEISIYWNVKAVKNLWEAIARGARGRWLPRRLPSGSELPAGGRAALMDPLSDVLRRLFSPASGFVNDVVKTYVLLKGPEGTMPGDEPALEWLREYCLYLSDMYRGLGDWPKRKFWYEMAVPKGSAGIDDFYYKSDKGAYYDWGYKGPFDDWMQDVKGIGRPEDNAVLTDLGFQNVEVTYQERGGPRGPDWPGKIIVKGDYWGSTVGFEADLEADSSISSTDVTYEPYR